MPKKKIGKPPNWWNPSLYNFTDEMPLEGWVWEFMRRARLLRILGDKPVDAMNPDPDIEHFNADYLNYYNSWDIYQRTGRKPFYAVPSVTLRSGRWPKGWPKGFHGQQYMVLDKSMEEYFLAKPKKHYWYPRIDLNRRDSEIKRDFWMLLEEMRIKHAIPYDKEKRTPRTLEWAAMHVLEVWDLHQFGL